MAPFAYYNVVLENLIEKLINNYNILSVTNNIMEQKNIDFIREKEKIAWM